MRIIRKHCGSLYEQCDVHVFDMMYNLCKHMTNRPIEMTTYKEQFNTINHHIAREMKRLDRGLVDVIARLGSIVAFFSLKTLLFVAGKIVCGVGECLDAKLDVLQV